jgi:hypothetical protein
MSGNSKVATVVYGGVAVVIGGFYTLWGLGFIPLKPHPGDAPPWIAVCAGVVFAAGGLAATLTILPGPAARRAISALTLVVVLGFAAIAGWIALGTGPRAISSPLMVFGPKVGEIGGRVMFGFGAVICALMAALIVHRALQAPTSKT